MDDLTALISELRLRSSIFFRSDVSVPWGIAFRASTRLRFHAVLRGECWLGGSPADEPVRLTEMEVALVVGDAEHWVADQPGRPLVSSRRAVEACDLGHPLFQGGETVHTLMCGQSTFADGDAAAALLRLLPRRAKLSAGDEGAARAWRLVEAIDQELLASAPGHEAVIDRLTEALFVSLIRRAVEPMVAVSSVTQALRDPYLPRAIRLIHEQPEERWTIESLAAIAGMSRAAFARRFKEATGTAPMTYVTAFRIAYAKRLLRSGSSTASVATSVGYESTEAFRKLFKRMTGQTPAAYARQEARPNDMAGRQRRIG